MEHRDAHELGVSKISSLRAERFVNPLKQPIEIETAFNSYTLTAVIGEGGAGRVYAGRDAAGTLVAVKVLLHQDKDKRRRFKNEIGFLAKNRHSNIVTVSDYGLVKQAGLDGPFYVMPRFDGSLRDWIDKGITPSNVLPVFSQILDGVEAAHMLGVTHRDLKPENILTLDKSNLLAVADFGVANFNEDFLVTPVKTPPGKRLANFQYAAPEQRTPGVPVGAPADIYALGMMLNELFTRSPPHGSGYATIGSVAAEFGFLDAIVDVMIRQNSHERPDTVAKIKSLIQRHQFEAVSKQKLDAIQQVVVPVGKVTDPLAFEPPKIVGAHWDSGTLLITLDRSVNPKWIDALHNLGNYSSVMGIPPEAFQFNGAEARVATPNHSAQDVIDHFKQWLPQATRVLKHKLESEAEWEERRAREDLRRQREAEETKLKVNQSLRF